MGARKFAFVLLAMALLPPLGFCTWSQAIDASVSDQNGLPVAGAAIRITYQKANGITGNDGLAEGKTGEDGHYSTTIENTVPAGLESMKIKVEASTFSWQGGAMNLEADGTGGTLEAQFFAPFSLGKVTVIVLQKGGAAASGASVFISGSELRKTADSFGRATFYLPSGTEVSGFASYGSEGDYFTSTGATTGADGGMEILVKLPQTGSPPATGSPAEGSTVLTVYFIGTDNKPLGGEKVSFFQGGGETAAYTDTLGAASVVLEAGGEIRASMRKNDYDYSFAFNVTADGKPKSETAVLAQLLKIEYFESVADGAGCWRVSAKVTDPRTNHPITVKMSQMQNGSSQSSDLQVALDEGGMYSARVCAGPDALVRAVVSNSYDTVEKTIAVTYAGGGEKPQPGPAANATGQLLPQPIRQTSPSEGLEVVMVLVAILVTVLGAAAIILGKSNPEASGGVMKYFTHAYGILLGSTVRPIVEYLRSILRRREPPVQPPMFQSPPPQGPMMPPI